MKGIVIAQLILLVFVGYVGADSWTETDWSGGNYTTAYQVDPESNSGIVFLESSTYGSTNWCLASNGGVASAGGYHGGYTPAMAIDGSNGSYWHDWYHSPPYWLSVTMADFHWIERIYFYFYGSAGDWAVPWEYYIQAWDYEQEDWVDVVYHCCNAEVSHTYTFDPVYSDLFRIYELNTNSNNAGLLGEFQAWESVFYSDGYMESATQDAGMGVRYIELSWSEDLTASGTDLEIQLASNNDNATWDYVGPDGTAGSYYTTAAGEGIWNGHSGDRYMRYKLFLSTSVSANSPILQDITVTFDDATPTPSPTPTNSPTPTQTGTPPPIPAVSGGGAVFLLLAFSLGLVGRLRRRS